MPEQGKALVPQDKAELRRQQETAEEAWTAIGKLPVHERQAAAEKWAGEHGHLFYWCCGSPVLGGGAAEQYYEASDVHERGERYGASVWYAG